MYNSFLRLTLLIIGVTFGEMFAQHGPGAECAVKE